MKRLNVALQTLQALQVLVNTTQARTKSEHRSMLGSARNDLARIEAAVQVRTIIAERCQRHLDRCLASDGPSCAVESSELREAERLLSRAEVARRIARQAITDYEATASATLKRIDVIASQGQRFLTTKLDRVGAVNAGNRVLSSTAGTASTATPGFRSGKEGAEVFSTPGLPPGFAFVPVALIDQSENPITGPRDFGKGYSIEDLDYAFELFDSQVLPSLANGANIETFSAADKANGINGMRSLSDTFHGFLGHDAIRLIQNPDGTYSISNGRHRTYVASQYGRTHVPALIVRGKP